MFAGKPMIGMSNMELALALPDKSCFFATWCYYIEVVGVSVMFAVDPKAWQGSVGAWHPRQGTTRLTMADYREHADAA